MSCSQQPPGACPRPYAILDSRQPSTDPRQTIQKEHCLSKLSESPGWKQLAGTPFASIQCRLRSHERAEVMPAHGRWSKVLGGSVWAPLGLQQESNYRMLALKRKPAMSARYLEGGEKVSRGFKRRVGMSVSNSPLTVARTNAENTKRQSFSIFARMSHRLTRRELRVLSAAGKWRQKSKQPSEISVEKKQTNPNLPLSHLLQSFHPERFRLGIDIANILQGRHNSAGTPSCLCQGEDMA